MDDRDDLIYLSTAEDRLACDLALERSASSTRDYIGRAFYGSHFLNQEDSMRRRKFLKSAVEPL